ncbi:MAG: CHAT domain-containing protein, partial [Ignavibacteriae bacterium]|nr:CHAT domain-containing protein [Ignavibacteriota bacterium]
QTNYKNAPYWLHAKNIRYGLSASLWKSTKISAKGNLLFAEYKDDVNPLAGVAIERKKIKGYWKGRFNEVDKKQDFLSIIESSNVIHVAGHAKSDTTDNGQNQMFFCSNKNSECILKGYELAGYNLTDQLVVLNACETNYGKVWDGEGVFSLARDFAGGGALSSVSNLWLVNDQSAQSLIVSMYKY